MKQRRFGLRARLCAAKLCNTGGVPVTLPKPEEFGTR